MPKKQQQNSEKTARKQRGRPFKPGESGNPNGRPPKGYSITEMVRELLGSQPDVKKKIGQKVLEKALKGDLAAVKLVWGYMDGAPQQDVTSDGKPLGLASLLSTADAS